MPYYVREIAGVKGLDGEYLLDLSVFLREHGHPKWAKQVLHNINSDDALNLLFEKGILSLYIKNLNAMYETHNMSQHDKRFYEDNLAYLFSYCLKREGGCSESLIFQIIRASRNASYQGLFIAISSILSQLEHDRSDASYLMIKEMLKPYITGSNIVARQVIYTLLMNLGPHHSTGKALHVLLEDKQIRKSFQMTVDELGLKARL